jgi:hypothetical protein
MDTRQIVQVTFFVIFILSWLLLRACPKTGLFYRTSKVLWALAICGMVINGAGIAWNDLRGGPLEPQGKELANRATAEVGPNPTYAQAEEWLKRNGFEDIGGAGRDPRSGDRRKSYVSVYGWKTLANATPDANGTSVEISFFWELPARRFFGVEHHVRPLYCMQRPPEKGPPVPAVMPNAGP